MILEIKNRQNVFNRFIFLFQRKNDLAFIAKFPLNDLLKNGF